MANIYIDKTDQKTSHSCVYQYSMITDAVYKMACVTYAVVDLPSPLL